jgi:hypothetical protein
LTCASYRERNVTHKGLCAFVMKISSWLRPLCGLDIKSDFWRREFRVFNVQFLVFTLGKFLNEFASSSFSCEYFHTISHLTASLLHSNENPCCGLNGERSFSLLFDLRFGECVTNLCITNEWWKWQKWKVLTSFVCGTFLHSKVVACTNFIVLNGKLLI